MVYQAGFDGRYLERHLMNSLPNWKCVYTCDSTLIRLVLGYGYVDEPSISELEDWNSYTRECILEHTRDLGC